MKKFLVGSLVCQLFFLQGFSADKIELPEEELARESVTPIFERNVSTLNRNIRTAERIEANLFYGQALTEPVANVSRFGIAAYYNTSENHAFGLWFAKNSSGLSTYANQLNSEFYLDLNRIPSPDYTLLADYNFKAYYGKMSLTKSWVANFVLLYSAGAGVIKYVHKSYPVISLGIGDKIYFSENFALRLDLRLWGNNAPISFKRGALRVPTSSSAGDPVPAFTDFEDRFQISTNVEAGLTYLF
jgi:outer membrane beta-barrel protein